MLMGKQVSVYCASRADGVAPCDSATKNEPELNGMARKMQPEYLNEFESKFQKQEEPGQETSNGGGLPRVSGGPCCPRPALKCRRSAQWVNWWSSDKTHAIDKPSSFQPNQPQTQEKGRFDN